MRIKHKILKIVFSLMGISASFGQIAFDVSWTPYVTYYLSMVDINTGESSMPIFMAELRREDGAPDRVDVDIAFEIIIDSDALDVDNETLVKVETTQPLQLTDPVFISNMDLNMSTDALFDISGNPVPLNLDISQQMDMSDAEQMMSVIVQTGQLPN